MSSPSSITVSFLDKGPGLGEALSSLLARHDDLVFLGCHERLDDLLEQAHVRAPSVVVINYGLLRPASIRPLIERLGGLAPQARIVMWFESCSGYAGSGEGVEPQGNGGTSVLLINAIRRAGNVSPPEPPDAAQPPSARWTPRSMGGEAG